MLTREPLSPIPLSPPTAATPEGGEHTLSRTQTDTLLPKLNMRRPRTSLTQQTLLGSLLVTDHSPPTPTAQQQHTPNPQHTPTHAHAANTPASADGDAAVPSLTHTASHYQRRPSTFDRTPSFSRRGSTLALSRQASSASLTRQPSSSSLRGNSRRPSLAFTEEEPHYQRLELPQLSRSASNASLGRQGSHRSLSRQASNVSLPRQLSSASLVGASRRSSSVYPDDDTTGDRRPSVVRRGSIGRSGSLRDLMEQAQAWLMAQDSEEVVEEEQVEAKSFSFRLRFFLLFYIIDPSLPLKRAWDAFLLLCVLFSAVVTPVNAAFQDRWVPPPSLTTLSYCIDGLFAVDMILTFRTALVDEFGTVLADRRRLMTNYLRGWFVIDFLAAFPFDALITDARFAYLTSALRLLRLLRLRRLTAIVEAVGGSALLKIGSFVLGFALFAHFFGCIWYFVCALEQTLGESSWLDFYKLTDADVFTQYWNSFYFIVVTMTTVGYGDYSPHTDVEKILSVFLMFIGAIMYATIFGNVSLLLQSLDAANNIKRQRLDTLKHIVKAHDIKPELKHRLICAFDELWKVERGVDVRGTLKEYPMNLQTDVAMFLHEDIIRKVSFFEGCERGFIKQVVLLMRSEICYANDTVYHEGDTGTRSYFIRRGKIAILGAGHLLEVLGEGSSFGEYAMLSGEKREHTAKAREHSTLNFIIRDEFQKVLVNYPVYVQRFTEIADLRLMKQNRTRTKIALRKASMSSMNGNAVADAAAASKLLSETQSEDVAPKATQSDSDTSSSRPVEVNIPANTPTPDTDVEKIRRLSVGVLSRSDSHYTPSGISGSPTACGPSSPAELEPAKFDFEGNAAKAMIHRRNSLRSISKDAETPMRLLATGKRATFGNLVEMMAGYKQQLAVLHSQMAEFEVATTALQQQHAQKADAVLTSQRALSAAKSNRRASMGMSFEFQRSQSMAPSIQVNAS